jgi:RHS repeat-associated protein
VSIKAARILIRQHPLGRRPRTRHHLRSGTATIAVLATASLTLATAAAASTPRSASKPSPSPTKVASPANRTAFGPAATRSSDTAIDGWGDAAGYHIEVGRESSGFAWREVAVLHPAGLDESSWSGYQCLSGDGRYAAVAVLPTSVVNLATARDRGAFAYAVDLATGKVMPVASGVGLKYYSPGCGTEDTAVFTLDLGSNDVATEMITANLATGAVTQSVTVAGQVTSAVPTAAGVAGVMGSKIVTLSSAGKPTVLASAPADVFDLHPAADGGLSFLTATPTAATSHAYHEQHGRLTGLGSGPLTRMQLFAGRNGRAVLAGSTASDSAAASAARVRLLSDSGLPVGASASSLDGDALFGAPKGKTAGTVVRAAATGQVLTSKTAARAARVVLKTAAYIPPGATTPSPRTAPVGRPQPHGDAAPTHPGSTHTTHSAATRRLTGSAPLANTALASPTPHAAQSPTCAVPRLDASRQVMQPSPAQVSWASQMAEQGLLTSANGYSRPAGFDNMGFAGYAPNDDFPLIPLAHPGGDSWNTVPRSVYEAIMAQESNWSQASWHAPEGTSSDPLISDYYGAAGDIVSINYAGADCGYGIGQVTDGMRLGDTDYSARGQAKIAVDYQENIVAGLQILESTWNQLYSDGIIANNGDPRYLENWYFAAWAYNSGIQPTGSYNPDGCTPGPTCTGDEGTWGMGWANNPDNLDYPPSRAAYLQLTYDDAKHPSSWPYQERIMGWMGSALIRDNGPAYNPPDYHGGKSWLQIAPFATFCSLAGNNCDPTKTNQSNPGASHCMYDDFECWWHQPATWIPDVTSTGATSAYEVSGGSEPGNPSQNQAPTCSLDTSKVPSNSIIVDDQPSPPTNLMGCGSSNWTSNGTFSYAPGTNSSGDPIGDIDTHQLGSGFGGRILFTHTEDGSNPDLINTGTWTPTLPSLQYYKVKIHLPALGGTATNVVYTINPGGAASPWKIRVNQAWNSEQWVTIGTFAMQNGGNVVLTNQSTVVDHGNNGNYNFDVAYDAVAFVPEGGTPGTPIGGPPGVQDAPKGSNPAWVQCGCVARTAGDPVDTATGYYGDTWTDLSTPGRGVPLNFTRTYTEATADPNGPNKTLAGNGPFGYGWTFSYNLKAATNGTTGAVTVTQEDGSQVAFTDASGVYTTTEPRNDATLTKTGTTYTYTRRGRQIFTFDTATGHLTSEQDLAGAHASTPYKTALAYNGSGQLSTITDPAGRVYTLTWTSGHITQLKDSAGRTVTYAYDTSNDLTDAYGVGSTRSPSLLNDDRAQYTYNTTTHLMTSFRTPKNYGVTGAVTAMTYDSSERVLTQTDADGRKTTFTYGPSSSPSLIAGQTLVTDPSGHQTLDTYSGGLLTKETKGYGSSVAASWSYTYDPITLGVSTMSDPADNVSTFSYDDHGNKISSSDADGHTTSYAYDNTGDITETIDPAGVATVNLYDQAGHVGSNNGTFTWGDLTSSTVTEANNVAESQTGNFGPAPTRTTNFYYDDTAHPADRTRIVNPNGNTTTATYDTAGDLASSTDPLGQKTLSGYDTARGWLTSTVAPSGTAAGTTTSCTPPATGCTTYAHDLYGHVTITTDALGHTSKASFDADGDKTSATDGDGNLTKYTFDAADQQTVVTRADNSTITTAYNGDGTVNTVKDAAGAITSYGYDAQGRQTSATNPDNRVTTSGYDPVGHPNTVKDPAGATTTTSYDPAGRATAVTYSDGATSNVTGIGYDADGRRTTMTDGTGTSSRSYDTFGELVSAVNGGGATVAYGYDNDGNPTSITYPDGSTVTNGFNISDQLVTVTDSASNTTTFGYNPDGANTTTTYPNGDTVTNAFNTAEQQTSTTLAQGQTTLGALSYGRDNAGQLASRTPSGQLTGAAQTYSYTALQQVKTDSSGSYGYDPANNPTALPGANQKFDPAGQLCWNSTTTSANACTSTPAGATSYTFNTDGQRTNTTPGTGTASSYGYDQAGELTTATTPAGSGSYTYDGTGLRASKSVSGTTTHFTWGELASGSVLVSDGTTDYLYGPGGLPIEQTSSAGTCYYVHDQLGSTVALTSSTGPVVGTYSYNTYGQASHAGTATTPLQYGAGFTDAETGFVYLQARYYDPTTAQFLTIDPELATTRQPYIYIGDNPLNGIDPAGLCWPSWACGAEHAVGHVAASAARATVDVVAVVPYAIYYGSYYAAKETVAGGCSIGACWAGHIAALPWVPFEGLGLGLDLGLDGFKTYTGLSPGEGFADESSGPSDKRPINPLHGIGGVPSWLRGGPSVYLPGVSHRNGCTHTDFEW